MTNDEHKSLKFVVLSPKHYDVLKADNDIFIDERGNEYFIHSDYQLGVFGTTTVKCYRDHYF